MRDYLGLYRENKVVFEGFQGHTGIVENMKTTTKGLGCGRQPTRKQHVHVCMCSFLTACMLVHMFDVCM